MSLQGWLPMADSRIRPTAVGQQQELGPARIRHADSATGEIEEVSRAAVWAVLARFDQPQKQAGHGEGKHLRTHAPGRGCRQRSECRGCGRPVFFPSLSQRRQRRYSSMNPAVVMMAENTIKAAGPPCFQSS